MKKILCLLSITSSLAQAQGSLTFSRACESGDSISIAAVGDILLHKGLQVQAFSDSDRYKSLWRNLISLIEKADFAYANFEGPAAAGISVNGREVKDPGLNFDNIVYTSYPRFNYHPSLALDLKESGFDVVSTANNHSLDRMPLGVDKTIDSLNTAGLLYTGTRKRHEVGSAKWYTITKKDGWSLAWVGCTFSTNGIADPYGQVLMCFRDESTLTQLVSHLSRRSDIDAVIVTPHWGETEYIHTVEPSQKRLGLSLLNAGATAVIGNHPHVIKPMEKVLTKDGRETFIIYSIGNFVSGQKSLAKRTSVILHLGLTKRAGRKAWVNGATYVPTYMMQKPWELFAADQDPRLEASAGALAAQILGASRMRSSRDPIEPNFECRQ